MNRSVLLLFVGAILLTSALAAGVTVQDKNLEISNGGLILTSSPVYSDLVPSGSHNLGSSSARWNNIYISGSLYDQGTTYYVNPAGTSHISGLTASAISVSTLSVSGSATIPVTSCNYLATDSSGKIICSPSASSTITGSGTTNYIPKFTGAHSLGNSQIYDNGTNVGIGTSSPSTKLDVSGAVRATGYFVRAWDAVYGSIDSQTGLQYHLIGTYHGWDVNGVYIAGYNAKNNPSKSAARRVYIGGSGSTVAVFDLMSGNVGIGTVSPGSKLDVAGEIRGTQFTDRDNTAYYVNPASTSVLSSARIMDNLDLNADSQIRITDGSNTVTLLKPYGPYSSGFGVYLQSGGQLIIGSGESASTTYSNVGNAGNETTYLTSDSTIRLVTGLQGGWGARYMVILDTTGNLYPERDNNISLGKSSNRWKNLYSVSGTFGAISTSTASVSGTLTASGSVILSGSPSCAYLGTDSSGKIICSPSASSTITGSGTTNYIPKFTGAHSLGNSAISDDGSTITIGRTTSLTGYLKISGAAAPTPNGNYLTIGGDANNIVMSFPRVSGSNDNAFIYAYQSGTNDYDLRLYLQDDQSDDERFSIWGGSCSNGGCSQGTANAIIQHYFTAAGNAYHRGSLRVGVSITTPTYYVSDSSTKLTKGNNSALRITTPSGYVDIGPQNTSWAHFNTDRPKFYFNKGAAFAGTVYPYTDNDYNLGTSSNRWKNVFAINVNTSTINGATPVTSSNVGSYAVTHVTAGTGLTGGGGPGSVTVSLDTSYTDGRYVNVTGDTMSGALTVNGNFTANHGATISLAYNGGGVLKFANNQNDNKIYIEAFSSDQSGSASELLLTGRYAANLPQITLKANNVTTSGSLTVGGTIHIGNGQIYWDSSNNRLVIKVA